MEWQIGLPFHEPGFCIAFMVEPPVAEQYAVAQRQPPSVERRRIAASSGGVQKRRNQDTARRRSYQPMR